MARLLVTSDSTWYEELSILASYYESEFEKILKQHVNNVFPDYVIINFKLPVFAEQRGEKKPDLAMIRKDYQDWWIVEVELIGHQLEHVLGQVEVFSQGQYNAYKTARYILKQCEKENKSDLEFSKLRELIKSQQPKVLVIVDEPKEEWGEELRKLKANLCVFQVFKNTKGFEAYRLDGLYPQVSQMESHCRYHEKIPNLLKILDPSILSVGEGEEIEITYNGKITKWSRIDDEGSVYLRAIGVNPVPENNSYVLFKDMQNRLTIKLN